jgi:hypothetical protein
MMNKEELKASQLILDLGVAIPLRPLRFLNSKRQRKVVIIRQPYMGGLIRMCEQAAAIGINHNEIKAFTIDDNIKFMATHGKTVSRIVAGAIVRGYLGYKLFNGMVAWWLRWRVHPLFLLEAMFQLFDNMNISPFENIIRLVQATNLMKPRLSHLENGS